MSIYKVVLFDGRGEEVENNNFGGVCTGIFSARSGDVDSEDWVSMDVQFRRFNDQPFHAIAEKLANCALMQSLVPGTRYIGSEVARMYTFHLPNAGELPADQVNTALRILKIWTAGYLDSFLRYLAEWEPSFDEAVALASFLPTSSKLCDSFPGLYHAKFSKLKETLITNPYYLQTTLTNAFEKPRAAMLLPLCRGETRPGWQASMKFGYVKSHALFDAYFGGNNRGLRGELLPQDLPDDTQLTVNHCVIHEVPEGQDPGPLVPDRMDIFNPTTNYEYLEEVIDWIFQQLHP